MIFKKYLTGIKIALLCFFGISPKIRYESRHAALSAIANAWGFRLYNKNLIWTKDHEFLSYWQQFKGRTSERIHERRFNLYYLAKNVKRLNGDTAECGSLHGAGSFLIMKATACDGRMHHVFDSFEGLSSPGPLDKNEQKRVFVWQKGDLKVGEEMVANNLAGSGNFKLYKGWIPARFNEVEDKKFAFVHIDVDLYEPTYESLEFFYERMIPGGIIVCDDYGSEACPGAYKACNDFIADKIEEIIHLTGGQGVVIKSCYNQ
jgi:hypothetical protein